MYKNDNLTNFQLNYYLSNMYFKSLSGDIIPISLSSLIDLSIDLNTTEVWNAWNRITSIIASENGCKDCQVVIFDESCDDKPLEPPELVQERQYNFLVRDLKDFQDYFNIDVTYLEKNCDTDEDVYNRFCIEIYIEDEDIKGVYRFCIYEDENREGNIYFCEKGKDESFSIYEILCNIHLPVPWYDRQHMIDRIMERYNDIDRYRTAYEEDWDRFAGYNE